MRSNAPKENLLRVNNEEVCVHAGSERRGTIPRPNDINSVFIEGNIYYNRFCLTGMLAARSFWVRDLPTEVIDVDPRDWINSLYWLAFS